MKPSKFAFDPVRRELLQVRPRTIKRVDPPGHHRNGAAGVGEQPFDVTESGKRAAQQQARHRSRGVVRDFDHRPIAIFLALAARRWRIARGPPIITTYQSWEVGMVRRRIGILTGGGDVPGLNAVIKSVTYRGSENDIEVVGLRRGWEALTHVNLEDPTSRSHYIIPLNRENTRTIDRRGGTVLHSSRTNPSKMQKLPDHFVGTDFPASLSTK